MDAVLNWGVEAVRAVQTLQSPALTAIMKTLTLAGSEYFFLLILPVVFWCIDERFGVRLGLLLLFSTFVNGWLKTIFRQPRPYDLDPSLGLSAEPTFGLPSGHSQNSAALWGLMAQGIRRPWGLILAVAVPVAVGFSRIYLGVHFPTDVFAGWILGWGIALAWYLLGHPVENFLAKSHVRVKALLAALVALAMNVLLPTDTNLSGVFFGTAVGAAFMFERVRFDASTGDIGKKLARLGLGLVGLLTVYIGGRLVSPAEGTSMYALARFVRYGLVGAWTSLGAPWLFIALKLADRRSPE